MKITKDNLRKLDFVETLNIENFEFSTGVSIDSRNIMANDIFVAIKGEKFDGHDFINSAIEKNASLVIIEESEKSKVANFSIPIIIVKDTVKALNQLAAIWRKKLDAKVISITGSNGKTTTKDILGTLLAEKYRVTKTFSNNNNTIGVPLTIFSADKDCDILILEHGTNHFGEIEITANSAMPDYAVITNVKASHLEFLNNKEGILEEKKALLDTAEMNKGTIIINENDELLSPLKSSYSKVLTYSTKYKADLIGKILNFNNEGYPEIEITYKEKKYNFMLPLLGKANVYNFILSVLIALEFNFSAEEIKNGLKKLKVSKGRLEVLESDSNKIIDDTYNANPASVENAIEILGDIKSENKIIILGDMFELGNDTIEFHKAIATQINKSDINEVIIIGSLMKHLYKELKNSNIIANYFDTPDSLTQYLLSKNLTNSTVLVKGSRGMKMEKFVNILTKRAI